MTQKGTVKLRKKLRYFDLVDKYVYRLCHPRIEVWVM
jgi:hypothetical protein